MKTLVVAEVFGDRIRDVTGELIAAAAKFDGRTVVAVIGARPAALAGDWTAGVDEVIRVSVDAQEFDSDSFVAALTAVIGREKPDLVLLPFSVTSMSYAPAVAIDLGLGYASDVVAIDREEGSLVATRAFYGSKVYGELEFIAGRPVMLLLRPGQWRPLAGLASPPITDFMAPSVASRTRHVRYETPGPSAVDITGADFILAVGRGIGQKEQLSRFEQLAQRMGATLAVSRPLVDSGWSDSGRQVGQSGQTVKPKVYLAMGISGAVQHVAGMSSSKTVIAINSDPEAPIFGVADYGAVADIFEVAGALESLFD